MFISFYYFMNIIDDLNQIKSNFFNVVEDIFTLKNFLVLNLLVLHVNIRTIIKNVDKLKSILNIMDNKPDVVVCSEA